MLNAEIVYILSFYCRILLFTILLFISSFQQLISFKIETTFYGIIRISRETSVLRRPLFWLLLIFLSYEYLQRCKLLTTDSSFFNTRKLRNAHTIFCLCRAIKSTAVAAAVSLEGNSGGASGLSVSTVD